MGLMPLPGAQIIHPRWAAHYRPGVTTGHDSTCTVTSSPAESGGGWSPTTGAVPPTAAPGAALYSGGCRIEAVDRANVPVDAAGQPVAERPYTVALDHDAPEILVGARVRVDACPDDPQLVGKILSVTDVQYGPPRWERVLLCDLDLSNQEA